MTDEWYEVSQEGINDKTNSRTEIELMRPLATFCLLRKSALNRCPSVHGALSGSEDKRDSILPRARAQAGRA
jgi:hypothetical protein